MTELSTQEDRRADAQDWARDLMWGPVPESRWFENCPHLQVCETEQECNKRHMDCTCPVAHEQATECAGWLREWGGEG